jgi:hypothetical protein
MNEDTSFQVEWDQWHALGTRHGAAIFSHRILPGPTGRQNHGFVYYTTRTICNAAMPGPLTPLSVCLSVCD